MNKLRGIGLILMFSIICLKGTAQEPVHIFSEPFNMVASDPLGFFYMVQERQIRKTDSLGQVLFTYSNTDASNISWLDASDPFRILVYYSTFNQLIFLDRTLSPIGDPVNLDNLEIFLPAGICRARQGGFWVVDQNNSSLIHLDSELKRQVDIRLSGMQTDELESWFPMMEWNERLYICRKGQNILQFDLYGTQLTNIPAKAMGFSTMENNILFIGEKEVYQYSDLPGILSDPIKLYLPEWEQLNISKNRALLQDQSGWYLYRLKKTP
jgi:hypothetical protein